MTKNKRHILKPITGVTFRRSTVTKGDRMADFICREGPVIRPKQSMLEQARGLWENTLIAKLHSDACTEEIATSSLVEYIRHAWNPNVCVVAFRDLGDNFISITIGSKEDKEWVLNSNPWTILGHLLVLREWPLQQPPDISMISKMQLTFTTSPFWVHAQGIPWEFCSEEMGMELGKVAGEVTEVDFEEKTGMGEDLERAKSIRIRVMVDITKRLALGCWLYISEDSIVWISFKYELLPLICYRCGFLGHIKKNCRMSLTPPSIGTEINLPNGASSEQPVVQDDHQVLWRDLTKRGYGPWIYYDRDVLNEDEVKLLSDVEEDI